MKCPICQRQNDDNWPVHVNGKILEGGCQDCWENDFNKQYWKMIDTYYNKLSEIQKKIIIGNAYKCCCVKCHLIKEK